MYYEEKVIDGILMFRSVPYGGWGAVSLENLTRKYMELEEKLSSLNKEDLELEESVDTTEYNYVWLNLSDGKFSNSWTKKDSSELENSSNISDSEYEQGLLEGTEYDNCSYLLIKFICPNDKDFEFTRHMVIK